jgi:O-succinylbenzoic acid--CoA ligase
MHPDRLAVGSLTYAELHDRALAGAGALAVRGARPGDRVAVSLPAGEEFAVALHACLLGGFAFVPVDLRLPAAERSARIAGAAALVDSPLRGGAAGVAVAREESDVAAVLFTSGTTMAPRPVELTHGNFLASALGSAVALGLDRDERWLCPMPLAHVGGLSILIRSAIYGTTALVHERFELPRVLAALSEGAATLVSLVPTMLARLLDAGLSQPPCLRWVLLGGGPIPDALLERALDAGVPVMSTYGMTEACSQIATGGWPLPGVSVTLAPDGEVLVRGPVVSPGAIAADGWLHTGDLGGIDAAGRLSIVGRKADTIVSGGENVAPAEVEAVLVAHPAIADAGVFGRPDPEWGEAVVARVVAREGAPLDFEELRAWCRDRLAPFKVPKAFEPAAALPRTASGKLLRRELS